MNTKEQAIKTLQSAYNTLAGNNLLGKHKTLAGKIQKVLKVLGGSISQSKQVKYHKGTEIEALAYIHNTIWKQPITDNSLTDEQTTPYFGICYYALKALADTPSTSKKDIATKIKVLKIQYSDYYLDEIEKLTLKAFERELTGKASQWGKQKQQ